MDTRLPWGGVSGAKESEALKRKPAAGWGGEGQWVALLEEWGPPWERELRELKKEGERVGRGPQVSGRGVQDTGFPG